MNRFVAGLLISWIFNTQAQTVSLGTPFFDDALRRAQLQGTLPLQSSFCLRPVDAGKALKHNNPYGGDSNIFPFDTFHYAKALSFPKARTTIWALPVSTIVQYNGHHPFGFNDGPMIPNVGMQIYYTMGFQALVGPLDIKVQPEVVRAQNKAFINPPYRPAGIDNPTQFGSDPYQENFLGQSHIKLRVGPLSAGVSNENIYWGPGMTNAVIMSNNAPGFRHYTIHTNRPIHTRYGSFEYQALGADLRYSGYYPYGTSISQGSWPIKSAADIVLHPDNLLEKKYLSGMCAIYQPVWMQGLSLGVTRIKIWDTLITKAQYFDAVTAAFSGKAEFVNRNQPGTINANQLVSVFARYAMPESHAEIYIEWGRDDWAWDLEDFLTHTDASRAYVLGFRKLTEWKSNQWLQLRTEFTSLTSPITNFARYWGWGGFGVGAAGGATHKGQMLGAGIGPGSNHQQVGVDILNGFEGWTFQVDRLNHNVDMYIYSMKEWKLPVDPNVKPLRWDDSKYWVDIGMTVARQKTVHRVLLNYGFQLMKTFNYNWYYDPEGVAGPFRFPGLNPWSINGKVSAVYRF